MHRSEKSIEKEILQYLNIRPNWFAFKINCTGTYDPTKKVFRKKSSYSINGISDIIAVYKGLIVCLEVKTPKGRLSENQKIFLEKIQKYGGAAYVVRSIADAKRICEEVEQTCSGKS